jgi:hypothetical protein
MTLPFWPARSPARQYDADSDQTKDHRRAARVAKKAFRRVGVSCLRGTNRPSESYIAPTVAHSYPATGTEDTMMSRRARMTSALLLVTLTAASAADQRVWDECNQTGDTGASIAACMQILQAHDESSFNRAAARARSTV